MSLLQTRNNIRVRDGFKKKQQLFFPRCAILKCHEMLQAFMLMRWHQICAVLKCLMVYAFTMESAVQWDLIQKLIELQDEASQHNFESNIYV